MNCIRPRRLVLVTALCGLVCLLQACSKSHVDTFANCPDGIIDNPFEQCDDGNLEERDNCPSDCKLPFCGDTIAHVLGDGTEQCDAPDFVGQDCRSLGFAGGVLKCTSNCRLDTSECGPTFTPTSVPTETPMPTSTATATPSPVGGTATPTSTSTPTPTFGECVPNGTFRTVQVAYSAPAGSAVSVIKVLVAYPNGAVSLPTPPALRARIKDTPSATGVVAALPATGLTVQLNRPGTLPEGDLFTVAFDECTGAPPPPIDQFMCSVLDCASSFGPVDGCECTVTEPQ